jgi:hypothetical protein
LLTVTGFIFRIKEREDMSKSNGTNGKDRRALSSPMNGKLGGRPPKPFSLDQFDQLCLIQATINEIEGVLNMDYATIKAHVESETGVGFSDYFSRKKGEGTISLRRSQWQTALGRQAVYDEKGNVVQAESSPNVTMQIWLGKNELGQRDIAEFTGPGGGPIQYQDVRDNLMGKLQRMSKRFEESEKN